MHDVPLMVFSATPIHKPGAIKFSKSLAQKLFFSVRVDIKRRTSIMMMKILVLLITPGLNL
jgi:hypothetical protein